MIWSDVADHLTLIKSERRASSVVGTVAVSDYTHPDRDRRQQLRLHNVEDVRSRFTDIARDSLGFGRPVRIDAAGATRRQLWEGLEDFLAHDAERKVLYWTGHGEHRSDQGYFLACADSWEDGRFDPRRALALTDLVDRLLRPDCETDTLLIIDACFSHSHLSAALGHALDIDRASVSRARRSRRAGFAVIGTSGIDAKVPEGRWVKWLEEALVKPGFVAPDHARPFDPSALYLPLPYLLDAVDAQAASSGLDEPSQRPGYTEVRSLPNNFLDNPYFQDSGRRVYTPAELKRRSPWAEAEQFGLETGSHLHRHFAGRNGALARVVRWMDTHPKGLLAVTGLAGTGKTALIGRLALTSLPGWREAFGPELDPSTLPRAGTVHAALSCRGQSVHSLMAALWDVLAHLEGTGPLPERPVTPEQFCTVVDDLVSRGKFSLNLLFDALDEALPEQAHDIARHLLNPLSGVWGIRVVVGTRAQPRRRATAAVEEESLLDTLDQSVDPVVLGDDEEARRSIADMARSVLDKTGSPYQGPERDDDRDWTARLIAAGSHGSFLVARLTATELSRRSRVVTEAELSSWMTHGGIDLHERLAEEMFHLTSQPDAERAHEVLRPLAVVQGTGLPPGRTWLLLANALRDPGSDELTLGDLQHVCRTADGGIIASQATPHRDRTTHHLAHPSYGEFFLTQAGLTAQEAHGRVVTALRAQAGADWTGADDYTFDYLGAHAAQVGSRELRELFQDVEFLLRTNPDVMLPLAATLARDCDGAALYGRVADTFRRRASSSPASGELLSRKALLRATAFVSHREGTYRGLAEIDGFLPWQEYWTDMPPDPLEWRRAAPLGGARTLSWRAGTGAAELMLGDTLTAGGRGEILVLHPDSGTRLLTRRTRDADGRRGNALTEVREVGAGPHWTTIARDDQAIYFWRSSSRLPDHVYHWGGAVKALDAAQRMTETFVLAADGQRMWTWSWKSGMRGDDTHLTDIRMADVRQIAALPMGSRLFALVAGARAELVEVTRRAGSSGGPRASTVDLGRLGDPAAAAAATSRPVPQGPSGVGGHQGWIAVADSTHVHIWHCETDEADRHSPPVVRHVGQFRSAARGLAFGCHGDALLLAAYEEVTVRIWAVEEPEREAAFQIAAPRNKAMAFDPGGQGLLAVADGPDIRMLDVAPALAARHGRRRRPSNQRPAVALTEGPDGPPLLCRTWADEIRVSRPGRGAAATAPAAVLTHLGPVTAVNAVYAAGAWIVVAAAGRTVRMWRLSEDLSVESRHDLALGGDAGEPVKSLGLAVERSSGRLRIYVPDKMRIVYAEMPADASSGWHTGEPLPAGLRCCGLEARVMRDGTCWLAADLGDELRLWRHDGERPDRPHRIEKVRPAQLALGELYDPDDEESFPLLAWVDGGVYVKDYSAGDGKPAQRLPGDFPEARSLVFAGPPERPVLLVADERTAPRVRDLRAGTWLHGEGVPWRGYAVHAMDAAPDPEGLLVALQGNDRCDLVRLPHTFFKPEDGSAVG